MQSIMIFIFVLSAAFAAAQDKKTTMSIHELTDSLEVKAKPVLLLLSTDWCKYCKMQKVQLKKNKDFQAGKNNFYFIEFNAESKESVLFNGKYYHYKSNGLSTGVHELAIKLSDQIEAIAYPLWVILDNDQQVVFRRNGLLAPDELKKIVAILSLEKGPAMKTNNHSGCISRF